MTGLDENRIGLLEAARALLAQGNAKFSIAALCADAGVTRAEFRTHFSGKAALLAAVMAPEPSVVAESKPDTVTEPAVSAPDAWLERRLRVFERALGALETRAEETAQTQARAITHLEEQITKLGQRREEHRPVVQVRAHTVFENLSEEKLEPESAPKTGAALDLAPRITPAIVTVSREEMADVLQAARGKVRVPVDEPAKDPNARLRWLALGGLSLVVLFLCIGLSLGKAGEGLAAAELGGSGISHRHVGAVGMPRLTARADFGDANAQARLALAYLKGDGVAADVRAAARWGSSAAEAGQPVGQMLLGTLYDRGDGVRADAAQAARLFAQAAMRGNLKAMHNLGIAYTQGQGIHKDEASAAIWFTRAAEHGYVDSAFDLAVLYERGIGVPQDLRQAMKWYGIAAQAGDVPSKARIETLRGQMKPGEARLALAAAQSFSPLAPLAQANTLPEF